MVVGYFRAGPMEGLVPLKAWIKSALDEVIQVHLNATDLEFVWVGDDAVDPLQQAQTLNILVGAGIKTIAEARAELGLAPGTEKDGQMIGKWSFDSDQPRDERGRWTADGGTAAAGPKRQAGVQVALNDAATTMTDAGGASDDYAGVGPEAAGEKGPSATIEDVAYPGDFHDFIVSHELEQYEKAGANCVSEVQVQFAGHLARLDILCRSKFGLLLAVEVKTGTDPDFTDPQKIVYPHLVAGSGVISPDPKISNVGWPPGAPLPPIPIFFLYAPGPGLPYHV